MSNEYGSLTAEWNQCRFDLFLYMNGMNVHCVIKSVYFGKTGYIFVISTDAHARHSPSQYVRDTEISFISLLIPNNVDFYHLQCYTVVAC